MYLTYAEYQEKGGTLSEASFNNIEAAARSRIDYFTFNRLKNETVIPVEVKCCMFELINLIAKQNDIINQGNTGAIASQSNDGVSISYNTLSAVDFLKVTYTEVQDLILMYLDGVRSHSGKLLLYKGLYNNE